MADILVTPAQYTGKYITNARMQYGHTLGLFVDTLRQAAAGCPAAAAVCSGENLRTNIDR